MNLKLGGPELIPKQISLILTINKEITCNE